MFASYIKRIMHTMNCTALVCVQWEIIFMLLVGQVSGLLKNFNTGIFSDTITVINVKLCTMALVIDLYAIIPLSVTLTIFQGHSSVNQF